MTPSKPKSSYGVKFAPTEADRELLAAVERALESQPEISFSDLCKQALRQMLLPTNLEPSLPMVAMLEQQMMTLQLQLMQLEQRRDGQTHAFNDLSQQISQQMTSLTQQVHQLNQRVTQLETSPPKPAPTHGEELPDQIQESPSTDLELDPVLSRIAAVVDDF